MTAAAIFALAAGKAGTLGRTIRYLQVPIADYQATLLHHAASQAMAQDIADMIEAQNNGIYDAEPRDPNSVHQFPPVVPRHPQASRPGLTWAISGTPETAERAAPATTALTSSRPRRRSNPSRAYSKPLG